MKLVEWPYEPVSRRYFACPDYEWAYMKAELEGKPNEKTVRAYNAFFGKAPKEGIPFWFLRLLIYYTALDIGHQRLKNRRIALNGPERAMLTCLQKLNVELLKTNRQLWHYMYLHDVELARA